MNLLLRDPAYTDALASYLASLGQRPVVSAPGRLFLGGSGDEAVRLELELYIRVWRVLHPEAEVEVEFRG